MRNVYSLPLPAGIVLLLAGCSERAPGPAVVVRDSADIQVVESVRGAWDDDTAWRIDAQPVRTIGSADGGSAYVLHRVRGALMLGDGSIVVADAGSRQVRRFNTSGALERALGRPGDGPGEFRDMANLFRYGADSLAVFDRDLQRLTIVASDLSGWRVLPVERGTARGRPSIVAALDDESFVATANITLVAPGETRVWRDSVVVLRYLPAGSKPNRLWSAPGDDRYTVVSDGSVLNNNHPLGRLMRIATHGGRIYVSSGNEPGFDVHDAAGALERRHRLRRALQPVNDSVIDALRASWVALNSRPGWVGEVEQLIADMPMPDALPAVDRLHVDATGHVWLRSFEVAAADWIEWYVFDTSDGVYLGTVILPAALEVTDIGSDYILGVGRTPLGVEQVQVFTLLRTDE